MKVLSLAFVMSLALTGCHSPNATLKLYVFDCGSLATDPARFNLKREEVSVAQTAVACFLVVHPKGRLMWDVGAIPDANWTPTGAPVPYHLSLPDGAQRDLTLRKRLTAQLAEVGYAPGDITYLAFSHYHYDHTANGNAFAGSTWLVRKVERDAMFSDKPPPLTKPADYSALKNSKTTIIESDDYDVFGDGSVVIKLADGHTPGHQILYLKLAKTGGVVLSGDLYHFAEERKLNRFATFDFNPARMPIARAAVDEFLAKTGSQLWIQHDYVSNAKLKKSPDSYE